MISRRALLSGALALTAPHALAGAGPRIAAVDWAMLETLLLLDHLPVAAAELALYRRTVVEPAPPPSVADLGLRGALNFEQLLRSDPDLILSSPFAAWAEPQLERIAPVLSLAIYGADESPWPRAEAATREVARRIGHPARAEAAIARAQAVLDALDERLAGLPRRPVYVVNPGDSRHVRVFGHDSLFGDVLSRLDFVNAWDAPTSYRASAPVRLEALTSEPDSAIAVVGPVPPDALRNLPRSPLWRALPAVQSGRVAWLPPINPFGALPAALRFARSFADALTNA